MIKSSTCIAVIRNKKGKLVFAGDRRISWGVSAQVSPISKVVKRDGFLFGGTGNAYLCGLLCNSLSLPEVPKNMTAMAYAHEVLIPTVLTTLEEKGLLDGVHKTITSEDTSVEVVVGIKSELFSLFVDKDAGVGVVPINTPYATGCGGDFAMGSLMTTEGSPIKDLDRLKYALRVAAQASPGCDANVDIIQE